MPRIAVIGSCMVDLVTNVERMPERGETLAAPSFAMGFGGKGANQAVAAARLGADVMMVARVGDDAFGADTLRNFSAVGIDARHVKQVAGVSSGVAPIFVEPSGENRILIVRGANDRLLPADLDRAEADLRGCALILLQLENPLQTVYHAIAWGAANGVEVLLNPAPATRDLDLSRIASLAFFVPNQTELAILTGMPTDTPAQAEAAARILTRAGIRRVIVTLGAHGALLVAPDAPAHHVAPVRVQPRDTTGAGDAFIGAFAQHYVGARDVPAALDWASLYAADSITRPGTQTAFATAEEFAQFRRGLGNAAQNATTTGT